MVPVPVSRVANLHAFARLYGVVRWFRPSDAASAIDWDRFAIEGARRVIDVADARALRATLAECIAPVAPTVHIVGSGEAFPDDVALHPSSTAGLDVVAWQHRGYGDSTLNTGYLSKRRHRDKVVAVPGATFAILSQSVDAAPYRGTRIRLRGKLRTANRTPGYMWLRVDRGNTEALFDNMANRPVTSETWVQSEIVGTVDADATKIVFGTLVADLGTVWYDDLELAVETRDGQWSSIPTQDSGFEAPNPLQSWHPGTSATSHATSIAGWNIDIDHAQPASGNSSLRIAAAIRVLTEDLFDASPKPGETIDVELGSGLRARVPIALYSRGGHTLGDSPAAVDSRQDAPTTGAHGFDSISGVADVIVVWNIFRHFWPYWSAVPVDWVAELDVALADALDDRSVDDHVATLQRLTAAAPDGHVLTSCPGASEAAYLPLGVDLVEDQIVVTISGDKAVQRGDVLVSVDGRQAMQLLASEEKLVSGSPQWRHVLGLRQLGTGPLGSRAVLSVRRGATQVTVTTERIDHEISEVSPRRSIERLDDGVYYVDLRRVRMADIDPVMTQLAHAPGVVFDVRGRPGAGADVLSHLVTHVDTASAWEAIRF
jgi:hypothetical protein